MLIPCLSRSGRRPCRARTGDEPAPSRTSDQRKTPFGDDRERQRGDDGPLHGIENLANATIRTKAVRIIRQSSSAVRSRRVEKRQSRAVRREHAAASPLIDRHKGQPIEMASITGSARPGSKPKLWQTAQWTKKQPPSRHDGVERNIIRSAIMAFRKARERTRQSLPSRNRKGRCAPIAGHGAAPANAARPNVTRRSISNHSRFVENCLGPLHHQEPEGAEISRHGTG